MKVRELQVECEALSDSLDKSCGAVERLQLSETSLRAVFGDGAGGFEEKGRGGACDFEEKGRAELATLKRKGERSWRL